MRKTAYLTAFVLALAESLLSAQRQPTLDEVLERMSQYLLAYETQLSSVVAEERFEQRVTNERAVSTAGTGNRGLDDLSTTRTIRRVQRATLDSEVAFIRLPGGAEWLGFREVRKVNAKPVGATGPSLGEVLTSSASDVAKARSIANASARHNLGVPRTVNVPTAPLEIIHPAHREAHAYELLGDERVRGTRTAVVKFTESRRPTLVREPTGRELVSSGRIWIEPNSGSVWRVEWIYRAEQGARAPLPPQLRVDFAPNVDLGMMVPLTMIEVFSTPDGRGEGRADYRNFRRFGTSARIVPQ